MSKDSRPKRRGHPSSHSKNGKVTKKPKTTTAKADSDVEDVQEHAKYWERKSKLPFLASLSSTVLDAADNRRKGDALPQRLPVKDESGRLRPSRLARADVERQNQPSEAPAETDSEPEADAAAEIDVMSEADARQRIAELSSAAMASPESELKTSLDQLAKLAAASNHQAVRQMALLSQVVLFVDLCPSYPIRHHLDDGVQLTKQVKATRKYEAALLDGYGRLLEQLVGLTKRTRRRPDASASSRNQWAMGVVAIRGLCQLLSHLSHFNHCKMIVGTLVPLANHPFSDDIRAVVLRTLAELIGKPANADHAVDVVTLVCKIAIDQRHEIQPSLIRMLSALPLQHRPAPTNKAKVNVQLDADLKRDLQAGEAVQSAAKLHRTQRVILEKVFRIYFTILRSSPSSVLLPAVLDGLAKFAHLVNAELLLDLLSSLDSLMTHPDLPLRSVLNCIVAAFRMLQAQGAALVIDARGFYARLYNEMDRLAWVENYDLIGTCLNALDLMFIKRRQVSAERVGAFLLKLGDLALALPGSASKACLHMMYHILARYPSCARLLENDNCGFHVSLLGDGDIDPDQIKPFSTCLWQLALLGQSPDPALCKYSRTIAQQHTLPVDQLRLGPAQLLRPGPITFPSK